MARYRCLSDRLYGRGLDLHLLGLRGSGRFLLLLAAARFFPTLAALQIGGLGPVGCNPDPPDERADEGDQGKPTGSKDSKNYEGQGGSGDGMSYSLAGRTPKYLPKPSSKFQENGTVAVQITVDKYGKVVKAMAIDKGSNTTSSILRRLAEAAAKKAVFNANLDAAEMQRGTITYHFVVKN